MRKAFNWIQTIGLAVALMLAGQVRAESQVLAKVGNLPITAAEVEAAINGSPIALQFPSMTQDEQAALRGAMLKRLVAARLLYVEALDQRLDRTPQFRADLLQFRQGVLFRKYMDRLRASIKVSDEDQKTLKEKLKGDPDALAAARSSLLSERYRAAKAQQLRDLRDRYHLRLHDERLVPGVKPETELANGDGIKVLFRDISDGHQLKKNEDAAYFQERLYDRTELLLVSQAAEKDKSISVATEVEGYREERLPSLLLERMTRQWIPNEKAARAFFDKHRDIGQIEERRHVGQLVVATREEAESLRQRILKGESLFELAGQLSIDPWGREHNGDMGWMREGTAAPEIEKALAALPDNQVSEVVQTSRGYHLLMIINRAKGSQKKYEDVADRVRQAMIDERLPAYIDQLRDRHNVEWLLPMKQPEPAKDGA